MSTNPQTPGAKFAQAITEAMPTAEQIAASWRRAVEILNCRHDWIRERVTVEGYEISRCRHCRYHIDYFPDEDEA